MTTTTDAVADGLRAWAKGLHPTEAAVELLIRTGNAREGHPWIREVGTTHDGRPWAEVDWSAIPENVGTASGGERRVLLIAAAIGGGVPVDLNDALPGLDRTNLALVLAAMAHAGGSHEHGVTRMEDHEFPDGQGGTVTQKVRMPVFGAGYEPPLFPWPEDGE